MWAIGDRLYTRAPFAFRALTLFSFDKVLLVDRAREEVVIRSKYFWFLRGEEKFPFTRVSHIDFSYSSLKLGSEHDPNSVEALETFYVNLILRRPLREIRLFRFRGETVSVRDLSGIQQIVLSTSEQDTQENTARAFAHALATHLGVSIGPSVKHYASEDGTRYFCSKCKKGSAPGRTACLYCGGAIDAVIGVKDEEAVRR